MHILSTYKRPPNGVMLLCRHTKRVQDESSAEHCPLSFSVYVYLGMLHVQGNNMNFLGVIWTLHPSSITYQLLLAVVVIYFLTRSPAWSYHPETCSDFQFFSCLNLISCQLYVLNISIISLTGPLYYSPCQCLGLQHLSSGPQGWFPK